MDWTGTELGLVKRKVIFVCFETMFPLPPVIRSHVITGILACICLVFKLVSPSQWTGECPLGRKNMLWVIYRMFWHTSFSRFYITLPVIHTSYRIVQRTFTFSPQVLYVIIQLCIIIFVMNKSIFHPPCK